MQLKIIIYLIYIIFLVSTHFTTRDADPTHSEKALGRPYASFCEVVPHALTADMMDVVELKSPQEIHDAQGKISAADFFFQNI